MAFILRYADSRIVYFESTANTGVGLYSWDSFICSKMNESYSKVAFRKLKCTRRPDAMRKLETFVRSNNGAQY